MEIAAPVGLRLHPARGHRPGRLDATGCSDLAALAQLADELELAIGFGANEAGRYEPLPKRDANRRDVGRIGANDGAVETSFGKRVAHQGDRACGQSLTTPGWENHVRQVDVTGANARERLVGLSFDVADELACGSQPDRVVPERFASGACREFPLDPRAHTVQGGRLAAEPAHLFDIIARQVLGGIFDARRPQAERVVMQGCAHCTPDYWPDAASEAQA